MREIGRAEWIGTTARELIARHNFVGRVLGVVKGAVYVSVIARSDLCDEAIPDSELRDCFVAPLLAMTYPEILWLAQSHVPMHSRTIRGNFDFGALDVGMMFQSDGTCLQFDNQSKLQFADAQVWQPAMIDPVRIAPREVVIARVHELDPKGSLARKPFGSLRDLVGLGEGLTPSGDDFIGGLLFGQWHLRAAYPDTVTWDQRVVDELIEYARTRTNVISHAILRDHARGQSVEPLHHLVSALLQGKSRDEMMAHVQELLAIGNTSGQEMLAGMLMAMQSINPTESMHRSQSGLARSRSKKSR